MEGLKYCRTCKKNVPYYIRGCIEGNVKISYDFGGNEIEQEISWNWKTNDNNKDLKMSFCSICTANLE